MTKILKVKLMNKDMYRENIINELAILSDEIRYGNYIPISYSTILDMAIKMIEENKNTECPYYYNRKCTKDGITVVENDK